MSTGNPEGEESSGQLPDRSSDSLESEPARLSFEEPSYEGLSYEELQRRRFQSLVRQNKAQEQLGEWWNGKISFIEESGNREGTFNELQRELKRYDTYRERWEEIEAYSEKEAAKYRDALDRFEDLERSNRTEGRKLMYDWFKHLTTLGTGSIVILGALSNNLLKNASLTGLIPFVFLLLFASVLGALLYMHLISDVFFSEADQGNQTGWSLKHIGTVWLLTLGLFGGGIALFVVFATVNLLS